MSLREFVSPFDSIPVPDPENNGRIARKIPKSSLPLLSMDLIYVITPHAQRKRFTLVLHPGEILEVRTPPFYTPLDIIDYEEHIISNQKWIRDLREKFQNQERKSLGRNYDHIKDFVSPFDSISVPDPENKGRIARQIPKASLPLLSIDLTYVIAPHARRTSFTLTLRSRKVLEVRTPLSYNSSDIVEYEKSIVSNQEWIRRVHEKYQRREKESSESMIDTFPERDYILYLGMTYPFHILPPMPSEQRWVSLEQNGYFEIRARTNDPEELRATLSTWYHARAEEILPPLVEKYAAIMKLPVPELTYNCVESRWAICYPARKQIRFNVLLLKTPPDCIEYLVVHELSHFYKSGHKKEFWEVVSSYMPDYEIRRKKLSAYRTVL